jgi:UDP-N-acetylglucosamine 2-epimerase
MKKLKVVTVVGTRPEIIRLSRIISCLDNYCEHILVHTEQNYDYELNQIFFDDLKIRKPDFFLNSTKNSRSASNTIGNLITAVDKLFLEIKPDAMLVLGDTNSCLSVIPAKRLKIPIFHMEAGNRCFDQRVPEEINRRIVDHTSDVNLTYSDIARAYLIREGLPPDMIIKTGSPMFEVLMHYRSSIDNSEVLIKNDLAHGEYFVVSAHRDENIEPISKIKKLICLINSLAEHYNIPVIVSTHPHTRKCFDAQRANFNSQVRLLKPLGFFDYVKLQLCARATLSDSGTINEEASIMNFPALNIRETHERPEGMEEGTVMMVGLELQRVHQCLAILENQSRDANKTSPNFIRKVSDYSAPNVSYKVVRIIHSYTDYINRSVWKK